MAQKHCVTCVSVPVHTRKSKHPASFTRCQVHEAMECGHEGMASRVSVLDLHAFGIFHSQSFNSMQQSDVDPDGPGVGTQSSRPRCLSACGHRGRGNIGRRRPGLIGFCFECLGPG